MKKTILIEILLLFVFAIFLYFCVNYWNGVNSYFEHNLINEQHLDSFHRTLTFAILITLGLLLTLAAMILIAIKDLGCFKPMLAKIEAMKQARNEAKAEKAVVDKQARIAKLEKELEELKKD